MLELNLTRDQLSVLQRDVENAQRAMDAASQRFTATTLEGSANQTDIAILNPATPPVKPSSPRVIFNTVLSFFLGGLLAMALSLLAERFDRRLRSREDINDLEMPVLALINSRSANKAVNSKNIFSPKAI